MWNILIWFQDVLRVCALNCLQIFRMTMCQLWKGNHFAAVSWRQLFVAAAYWSTWSHLANLGPTEDSTLYPSQIKLFMRPNPYGTKLNCGVRQAETPCLIVVVRAQGLAVPWRIVELIFPFIDLHSVSLSNLTILKLSRPLWGIHRATF